MKRRGAVRVRPASSRSWPVDRNITSPPNSRVQLVELVARLTAEDPMRARLFLRALKRARTTGDRHAVFDVLRAFGGLGDTIAEAAGPSPLTTRPAQLADSWATVGRLIGSSMVKLSEQPDHHAG